MAFRTPTLNGDLFTLKIQMVFSHLQNSGEAFPFPNPTKREHQIHDCAPSQLPCKITAASSTPRENKKRKNPAGVITSKRKDPDCDNPPRMPLDSMG